MTGNTEDKEKPDAADAPDEQVIGVEVSAAELLEVGLWLEKTGVEFYRLFSEELEEPVLRAFFLRLMGIEMDHEKKLREMLQEMPEAEPRKRAFDEDLTDREYFVLLKSLSAKKIFPEGMELFKRLESYKIPADALPMAIEIEENSIKLFSLLKRFHLSAQAQQVIAELIKDEEDHISEVTKIYRDLG